MVISGAFPRCGQAHTPRKKNYEIISINTWKNITIIFYSCVSRNTEKKKWFMFSPCPFPGIGDPRMDSPQCVQHLSASRISRGMFPEEVTVRAQRTQRPPGQPCPALTLTCHPPHATFTPLPPKSCPPIGYPCLRLPFRDAFPDHI